jgi:hypothetical protein
LGRGNAPGFSTAKFGAGGPGFTLPAIPLLGYRRFDSRGSNSRGWYTDGIVGRQGDGIYGLSGVSLTAQSAGQTVSLVAECEQLELHYLRSPRAANWNFPWMAPVETIDTAGEIGPGIYKYTPRRRVASIHVGPLSDAPVRLFGWVAQNHAGITYETLGINGAQAKPACWIGTSRFWPASLSSRSRA